MAEAPPQSMKVLESDGASRIPAACPTEGFAHDSGGVKQALANPAFVHQAGEGTTTSLCNFHAKLVLPMGISMSGLIAVNLRLALLQPG